MVTWLRNTFSLKPLISIGCVILAITSSPCSAFPPKPKAASAEVAKKNTPINPIKGWRFKHLAPESKSRFVIGAWLGPDDKDAEMKVYKDANFNVVMAGRYMSEGSYCNPEEIRKQLDMAQKHDLDVMLDTYTQKDKPWGGKTFDDPQAHHPASLEELKWIHQTFGTHPALIGYMIGDDQSTMDDRTISITKYMRESIPTHVPWICQNIFSPAGQAIAGNPVSCPQFYPSLYMNFVSAPEQRDMYCRSLNSLRQACNRYHLISWPMFNVNTQWAGKQFVLSESLLRFQIYSSLAYGAQGIWYFTYRDYGSLHRGKNGVAGADTYAGAKASRTANWFCAQKANQRVALIGPKLLGYQSNGVLVTGRKLFGAASPDRFKIVTQMSDDLMVGILTKPGQQPLAMVVDRRVNKSLDPIPSRSVELKFSNLVSAIEVIDARSSQSITGNNIKLSLAGGEGMLLALRAQNKSELMQLASSVLKTWQPAISSREGRPMFMGQTEVTLSHPMPEVKFHFTLDGSVPSVKSPLYTSPLQLKQTTTVKVLASAPGTPYDGVRVSKKFFKAKSITNRGLYRFGEGSKAGHVGSEILKDHSGNGFDLRRQGKPTVSADTAPINGSTASMEFHGSQARELYFNDRVISKARTNFGIEAWVKPKEDSPCTLVLNGHPQTSGYGIWQDEGLWGGVFPGITGVSGPAYIEPDKWTHLFFIRNESEAIMYVDGVMMTRTPVTSTPHPPVGRFTIGGSNKGFKPYYFKGLIDEVRVFTFMP